MGAGSIKEYKYLLTESDTATEWTNPGVISVPAGVNVAADMPVAFTVTFRPGYTYALGDTIDDRWTPAPSKQLNHFKVRDYHDNSKTTDESLNHSLRLIKSVRYRTETSGWKDQFIPGDAWNGYTDYTYSAFHITCTNVGINEIGNLVGSASLYPNPAQDKITVQFGLSKSDNVSVTINDITGREIMTTSNTTFGSGTQQMDINTTSLNAGVYLCTIHAGSGSKTMKFTVNR
jgi:hypothetical protein